MNQINLYTLLDPMNPVVRGLMGLAGTILNKIPLMDLFNELAITPLVLILQPIAQVVTDVILGML